MTLSPETCSLIVQILAICIAGVLGAVCRVKSAVSIALGEAVVANILAQIVIAGGGPGACAGFILLPAYCAGAALLGAALRRLIRRKPFEPGQCEGCGYDLTGNVSGVCPECGRILENASDTDAPRA
jgi:hypothetical protein